MTTSILNKLSSFTDKTVLVTGATGQLGSVTCQGFLEAGARVIGADKVIDGGKRIDSDRIEYVEVDIAEKKSVISMFAHTYDKYKRLDVLINNAGVSTFEPFEERPEESFDWVMDVNLKGTFFCIQQYANRVREANHGGSIVNIASMYGVISPDFRIYTDCDRKNSEVYGATKAGIIQMTRYFATHLARQQVRINCISPGGILNPETPQGSDFQENYGFRCPMGRMALAEEMVGAILYLSSEAASYTTGQNIVIDGGMSCW